MNAQCYIYIYYLLVIKTALANASAVLLLKIVILLELCGVGYFGHFKTFSSLSLNEVSKKLLGEYSVCGEVVIICLKRIKSLGKRGGKTLELCLLLVREVEEIEVVGTPAVCVGIDLVLMPSRPAIRMAA